MNDLDTRFRQASASLNAALETIEVPNPSAKKPQRSRAPLAAAAALIAVLAIGGVLATRRNTPTDVISSATDPVETQAGAGIEPYVAPTEPSATETTASEVPGSEVTTPWTVSPGVTDAAPQPVSPMPRPEIGEFSVEPNFGTSITRVTDSPVGSITAPVSSGTQAFNADGSRLLLYRTRDGVTPQHLVYDLETWTIDAFLDLSAATDIEDIFWDPADPEVLRIVDPEAGTLEEHNVVSGASRVAHTFDGCNSTGFGNTSGTPSAHTSTIVVVCTTATGTDWIAHDVTTNTDVARRPAIPTASGSFDAPLTLPSGNGFVLVDDEQIIVLDADLEPTSITSQIIVSSAAVGADPVNGNDVLIATVYDGDAVGTVVVVDLATGVQQVVTGGETGYPYPPTSSTMSPAAGDLPWFVAVTTSPGALSPPTAKAPEALADEVMLVDIANGVTSRLAHHRMADAEAFDNWAKSYVAVSPDGSTVVFSSNWGGDTVDTFRIELS